MPCAVIVPDRTFAGPYNNPFYQPTPHLSSIQFRWGTGSTVVKTSNLFPCFRSRLRGGDHSMVKGYEGKHASYFAQSPGQREQRSSPARSTDNSILSSASSSSRSDSSKGSSSVDSSGKNQTRNIPLSSNANRNSPSASTVALHPTRRRDSKETTGSDNGSVSSSNTDKSMAFPERVLNQCLKQRKREMVDKLMVQFYASFHPWLEENFGIECYDDGEGGSGDGGGSSRDSGSSGGSGDSKRTSKKRQQRDPDSGDDDDLGNNDDGNGGRKNNMKRARRGSVTRSGKRFACPYFKNNPEQFKGKRTCCGPGWTEVHRLKEHLYRAHKIPEHRCKRCHKECKTEKELDDHLQSERPCLRKEPNPRDKRFNQTKEKRLRDRKPAGVTERDKWEEVYKILFPNEPLPVSPYYDGDQGDSTLRAEAGEFLEKEFPPLVRRYIELELDNQMQGIETGMKEKFMAIVCQCTTKLKWIWQQRKEAAGAGAGSSSSSDPDRKSPPGSPNSRLPSPGLLGAAATTTPTAPAGDDGLTSTLDDLAFGDFLKDFKNDMEFDGLNSLGLDVGCSVFPATQTNDGDSGYDSGARVQRQSDFDDARYFFNLPPC